MVRASTKALAVGASLVAAGLTGCGTEPTAENDASPSPTIEVTADAPTVPANATEPADAGSAPGEAESEPDGGAADPTPDPDQPGDVIVPFVASVELLGEVPGYTQAQEPPLEGFTSDWHGENGCAMEHREVTAGLPANDDPLTNDSISQSAAADLLSIDGLAEPVLEEMMLPIDGNPLFVYPFWVGSVPAVEGYNVLVASSYTPVQAEDGSWEAWGLDIRLACPDGVDVVAEFDTLMRMTQPYVYVDPAFDR